MDYQVAKTVVFDRERAIQAREMHRIAAGGSDRVSGGEVRRLPLRLRGLISFRQQAPLSFIDCGGTAV